MTRTRPSTKSLIGKDPSVVPLSCQRVLSSESRVDSIWIGPEEATTLLPRELDAYETARGILKHLCIRAPLEHKSGHPGGPLSAFTFSYGVLRRRDPRRDASYRMSAGHLSLLAYGLQYLGGRSGTDARLASPEAIIKHFRTPSGLPGHAEAGIGDIPFGCGPLGKGVSNALGHALGWKLLGKDGYTDVLVGDGDCQEGQILEAARVAAKLKTDRLVVHADVNDIQLSSIPSKVASADLAAIFSAMGWAVIEVQNGNDPAQVEAALDAVDSLAGKGRPIFVCYYTTMGYGIPAMEKASDAGKADYHGSPMKEDLAKEALAALPPLDDLVAAYEPHRRALGERYAGALPVSEALPPPPAIERAITTKKGAARKDFGATHLKALMEKDRRIVVLHGDLAASGGFDETEKAFPDRVLNVGAAEANMAMMAAGLRQAGMLPVTYTFAAFGTNEARASVRLIDVNLGHVRCAALYDCTHSGLSVGEDGETHQERNYLNVPLDHTQIWMPADSNQAAAAAERGMQLVADGRTSVYVFSARSSHPQLLTPGGEPLYGKEYSFDGSIDLVRGKGGFDDAATILAVGIPVHDAVAAADALLQERVSVRVLNVACVRPIDAAAVLQAALETRHLVVVEDHHSEGGLASQVADVIADFQLPCTLRRLGVNHYFPSGTDADLKVIAGLDAESIGHAVLDDLQAETRGGEDALVTVLYTLRERANYSRFRESVEPYLQRLSEDKQYVERLREFWAKSDAATGMPSTDDLQGRLRRDR